MMYIFEQAAVPRGRWQLHGERPQQVRREGKPCSTLHEGKTVIKYSGKGRFTFQTNRRSQSVNSTDSDSRFQR